jgi:two-component system NarL family response regulator
MNPAAPQRLPRVYAIMVPSVRQERTDVQGNVRVADLTRHGARALPEGVAVTSEVGTPIRLLVADDHDILRQGLVAVLERDPRFSVVATASNGEEAVAAYRRTQPDLAIMDLRMPVMEGPEAIRAIRAEFAEARVVVLTVYEGDVDIARALSAGAAAYVLKGMPSDELFEAIMAVHEGRQYIPPRITQVLDQAGRTDLTRREMDVLRLIVSGHSNREIAQELNTTEGTIKSYVNALLGKLGVRDRTQAATAAIRRGLVKLDEVEKDKDERATFGTDVSNM